jgi:hypothetical protein
MAAKPTGESAKLGQGMSGSVFFPPLKCKSASVQKAVDQSAKPLVMKLTVLAYGATAIQTGHLIRKRWTRMPTTKTRDTFAWQQLDQTPKRVGPEEYYILPEPFMCSQCTIADDKLPRPILSVDPLHVGLYMENGGVPWDKVFTAGSQIDDAALRAVRHLIVGILLLHRMGITHNDIRRANVLVNPQTRKPRLIDWELCHQHRPTGSGFYVDALGDDLRKLVTFRLGPWSKTRDLTHWDWTKTARLLTKTWPEAQIAVTKTTQARLLLKVLKLLRQGTDKHALLAMTLLPKCP